jgi:hypothetical protein
MAEFYQVFGLRIESELPLPELFEAEAGDCDVAIGLGAIAAAGEEERPGLSIRPDGALLSIPDVGRFLIRQGREIVVEPAPGGSERNLRLYLLGSAFGALLHQRGLLPLHANAIEIGGRAVAFMGHSGAGKSTMAAWFHDRGFRVLADDVCVVTFDAEGRPIAQGGIPRLRLWREALEASGRTAEAFELSFDDMDKYNVPTAAAEAGEPVELSRIYLLGKAPQGAAEGSIRRLYGVDAVDALVSNTYRGGFVTMMGTTRRHLADCLALVGKAPVFSAERRWGYDSFEAQARALEAHALTPEPT